MYGFMPTEINLFHLSQEEKDLIQTSITKLTGKLNELIERFYFHFLQKNSDVSRLFQNSEMVKQHNMFNVSLGVIISNIDNPKLIQDHLDEL